MAQLLVLQSDGTEFNWRRDKESEPGVPGSSEMGAAAPADATRGEVHSSETGANKSFDWRRDCRSAKVEL